MAVTELSGAIAAALTPLDATLAPDSAGAVAHCRRLLEAGCDGINLLGTTGEATSFSVEQRLTLMRAVAASGLPLERFMVGTGAAALDDAVQLTRAAVDLGYAAALVIPPFYFTPVEDGGVAAFYRALIERVARPRLKLFFYNFPQLSGVEIRAGAIASVVASFPGTAAGVKDSSGAPGYARALVARFPELAIFPSTEAILLEARDAGFTGCISATLNLSAPLAADVWRADRHDRAATQSELTAIREIVAAYPLVPALRAILSALTGDAAWERMMPPLAPLDDERRRSLVTALERRPSFATLAAAARR